MKAKRILPIIVVMTSVLGFWPPPAKATLITIAIEGYVDSVSDPSGFLEASIKVGDIMSGTYIYDSSTPDANPSLTVGHYWHYESPAGISLGIAGFNFRSDPGNVEFLVGIGNNEPGGNDAYWLSSYNNLPLANGALVDSIGWQLEDPTGGALGSDALPSTPPVLTEWESNALWIHGVRGAFHILGEVTSVIPEPSTLVLLTLGGFVLVVVKPKKE